MLIISLLHFPFFSDGNGCELQALRVWQPISILTPLSFCRVISLSSTSRTRPGRLQGELSLVLLPSTRLRELILLRSPQITIFPEWNTEWLTPWLHYIPAKVDLSDIYRQSISFPSLERKNNEAS